jgi:hypothetical protein
MIGEVPRRQGHLARLDECPYYVFRAVKKSLGCGREGLNVIQEATGGAFGGRGTTPASWAAR